MKKVVTRKEEQKSYGLKEMLGSPANVIFYIFIIFTIGLMFPLATGVYYHT